MREKSKRYENVGRPRCSKKCCQDSNLICVLYEEVGMTSDEIARDCGVSDEHIIKRLHRLGAKIRPRGSYKLKKDGSKRKGVLWYVEDKELFGSGIKELAFKYHMSNATVSYVRSMRKKK